jgi:hypothetical protein
MLKAIRFDEKKHKDILEWLKAFRDKKNKENESEAARFLMKKGIEYLTLIQQENVQIFKDGIQIEFSEALPKIEEKETLNKDNLKKELMDELLVEVNNKMLTGLNSFVDKLNTIQIPVQTIPQNISQPIPQSIEQSIQNTRNKLTPADEVPPPSPPMNPSRPVNIKRNTSNPNTSGNALLANLLGNADR